MLRCLSAAARLRRGRTPTALFASLLLAAGAGCGGDAGAEAGRFYDAVGPDGARIRLDAPPERVLPANLHAAELLSRLVPHERFAGVPVTVFEFGSGFGERSDWEANGGPGLLQRYRGEDVLALRPDLVVSGAYQDLETTALLRRAGIPVLGLPTVRRFEDVADGLALLGRLLDREERAAAVVEQMRARRAELAERAAAWRGREALVYTNYGTGAWTQGIESPAEVLLQLAGLVNAAGIGEIQGHFQLDVEQLVALDPDVIVCGAPVAELGASASVLREHPLLRTLTAVRTGTCRRRKWPTSWARSSRRPRRWAADSTLGPPRASPTSCAS